MRLLCNPEGYRQKLKALAQVSPDAFYPFFSGGKGVDGAFARSTASWEQNFQPFVNRYVTDRGSLREQTSLDIGYGGGVHVMMAAEQFKAAYGIDVHEQDALVMDILNMKGADLKRIILLRTCGRTIPLPDDSIDFVHSWTTFMHLGKVEVVKHYLRHIHRVLKPGGLGLVFYSRLIRSKRGLQTMDEYRDDLGRESSTPGYQEGGGTGPPNAINLQMAQWYFESLVYQAGMQPVHRTVSGNIVEGKKMAAGQHGTLMRKPDGRDA